MRIALVHKRLDLKGGTERDLYQTAEGLRDRGHEVHLFCCEFGVAPPHGTCGHRIPVLPLGRTARLWSLALFAPAIIRKHRCEIVVSFGRTCQSDIVRSGGGTHRGFLEQLGEDGGARRRIWQGLSPYHHSILAIEKRQFSSAPPTRVIAVSNLVKRDIIAHYNLPAERITVIFNGVDGQRFQPSLRSRWRCLVRKELSIPEHAPVVLFVGSGFRRKGLDRLLAAWKLPPLLEVYLLVVGDDARIGQYRDLANTVARDRVVFTGRQPSIERYYGAADIVALPSIQEAFGNVVLEALSCGLGVVVARAVGASEVLQGNLANGVVEHPDDPMELAQKIAAQLKLAQEPWFGAEARRLAQSYSWDNHFHHLDAVLTETRAAKYG